MRRRNFFALVGGASLTVSAISLLLFVSPVCAETEIDKLIERAEKGDAVSQFQLGEQYRYGFIVTPDGSRVDKNAALANRWLRKAAEQGLPAAQFMLGEIYYEGEWRHGVKRDEIEAAQWLSRFLQHTNLDRKWIASAQYMLGMMFYQECDLYWLSLDCGSSREGKLLFKNYGNAAMRFRAAAEAGHREAQYQLATMYQTGRGVPQDYAEAAKWYRAAAEVGSREARGPLGKLYAQMGDHVSAHMWFNLAAIVNDPWAPKSRDDIAKLMTPAQIAEAQKLARQWDTKHKK